MLIAVMHFNETGDSRTAFYDSMDAYIRDTFSPEWGQDYLIEFKVRGRSYAEKKNHVRNLAVEMSTLPLDTWDVPWFAEGDITEWFETMGRRYGLVREFTENGII